MTRRRWLWVTGAAMLALFAVLAALDARLVDEGGWGIVDFELAGSEEQSQRMVAAWGDAAHDEARLSLWLDYLYMAAYGAFFALAVAATRDGAARRGWERFARLGSPLVAFPIAAALCDAAENAGLLLALGGHGSAVAPRAATIFAVAKFVLIDVAILYVVVGLLRRAWARRPRLTGALLGLAALLMIAVAVLGVIGGRETEDARARDGGRVLDLPGGDLNVVDRGPRGPDALVLLHGYTGSTRWWSRVDTRLARGRRVVNVDLLGHGGSEKPRDGYGMDEQARRVLAALRRLGVRRAVVAGHSMGGWVAVSMAEQDPRLVRGVAVIGTPADEAEGPGALADRVGYLPIVGPAVFNAVPESYVRAELESAFAEGVDVPDAFVEDTRGVTHSAFDGSATAGRDFREERTPAARMRGTGLPFLAIVGTEDDRVEAEDSAEWDTVPGRVVRMRGIGHTPPWEAPAATARLLSELYDRSLATPR